MDASYTCRCCKTSPCVFGATVVGLTARASEVRQGSKRGAIGFRTNGALRRRSSKVGRNDAVVDGESGGTTTAERGERIMSGIRPGSKNHRKWKAEKGCNAR